MERKFHVGLDQVVVASAIAAVIGLAGCMPVVVTRAIVAKGSTDPIVPPPAVVLASAAITSSTAVTLTAQSCSGISSVLINEGAVPASGSAGWQGCTSTLGALSYTLTGVEGAHALKAWAKSSTGAVSPVARTIAVFLDTILPTVTSFTINGGASAAITTVPLSIVSGDGGASGSGIVAYRLSLDPGFSGVSWASAPIPTQFTFPYVSTSVNYTLYLQVRDAAGNVSTVRSAPVTVSIGPAPSVLVVQPNGGVTYSAPGQAVRVAWKATVNGSNALSPTGISISYSTDNGVTTQPWPSGAGLDPVATADCTVADISAGATGCKSLGLPGALVSPQTFIVIVKVVDVATKSALASSRVLNGTVGLSLVAGNNSAILGGSAASTALSLGGALARDPVNGDLYFFQGCQILRVPASTGTVQPWVGDATNCAASGDGGGAGIALASVRFDSRPVTGRADAGIAIDSARNVYWFSADGIWKYDRAQNKAFMWVGFFTGSASNADGTQRRSFDLSGLTGQVLVGGQDTLYFGLSTFVTLAGGVVPSYSVFYRVEGNVVRFLAGGLADTSPATMSGDPNTSVGLSSIAIKPGATLAQDRIFVGQGYPSRAIWELVADTAFPAGHLNLIKSSLGSAIRYLAARGVLLSSAPGYTYTFVDPNSPATVYPSFSYVDGYHFWDAAGDASGGFFYIGTYDHLISYVDSANSRTTFAGVVPDAGDSGSAVLAEIRQPRSFGVDSGGNLVFMDFGNSRFRKVDPAGVISAMSTALNLREARVSAVLGGLVFADPYNRITGTPNAVDASGVCVYLCGTSSALYIGDRSTMPPSQSLATLSGLGAGINVGDQLWTSDGTDVYLWAGEGGAGGTRSSIKKVTAGGALRHIAGTLAAPNNGSHATVDGATLNLSDAGNVPDYFWVKNQIVYMLSQYGKITTSDLTAGSPIWREQPVSLTSYPVGMVASGVTQAMYYTLQGDTHLYKKIYAANGSGAISAVADFAGSLSNPVVRFFDTSVANTVILSDGNQIYRYTDAALIQ